MKPDLRVVSIGAGCLGSSSPRPRRGAGRAVVLGLAALLCTASPAGSAEHKPIAKPTSAARTSAAPDPGPPLSRDALFGLDEPPAKPSAIVPPELPGGQAPPAEPAGTRDALFGLETPGKSEAKPAAQASIERTAARDSVGPRGYLQSELAYTYGAPEHWSKTMLRLHVGTGGQQGGLKWKASARLDYNPVYDLTNFYAKPVRDAERARFFIHEAYVDFASGDWEWRVGRQNIVWGEMVGLFFADVVSAKDLREFVLPDFQIQRIPQWAVRAERFGEDWHTELVWIPYPSYDLIGKPGGDFYPYPPLLPGFAPVIEPERKPARTLKNTNYGVRVARLIDGWDLSAFYYNSLDAAAVFPRELTATTQTYRPRHERIWQAGGTLGKDLQTFVLKAELIYTDGRRYNLKVPTTDDGLIEQDTLDWVIGADFQLESDTRLNAQLFQRIHFDHDPRVVAAAREHGVTLLVGRSLGRNWEAEALFIRSLNRNDWLLRPKLTWKFLPDWRLTAGVDVLHGPMTGLFGRFSHRDRVYAEIRHAF